MKIKIGLIALTIGFLSCFWLGYSRAVPAAVPVTSVPGAAPSTSTLPAVVPKRPEAALPEELSEPGLGGGPDAFREEALLEQTSAAVVSPEEFEQSIIEKNNQMIAAYSSLSPGIQAGISLLLKKMEDPAVQAQMDLSKVDLDNMDEEAFYARIDDPEMRDALRTVVSEIVETSVKLTSGKEANEYAAAALGLR